MEGLPDEASGAPKCEMRLWVSGIPRRVRVYDLRHSFATLLRRASVDIGAVQRHMGHASPETTARPDPPAPHRVNERGQITLAGAANGRSA